MRIKYTVTSFKAPTPIDSATFELLKERLHSNPNLSLNPETESYGVHFKDYISIIKNASAVILFVVIIAVVFSVESGFMAKLLGIVGTIAFLAVVFGGVQLMLEGDSYNAYLKQKEQYFEQMKASIIKSRSYSDFKKSFYHQPF